MHSRSIGTYNTRIVDQIVDATLRNNTFHILRAGFDRRMVTQIKFGNMEVGLSRRFESGQVVRRSRVATSCDHHVVGRLHELSDELEAESARRAGETCLAAC
jgi:hypothetical protein